MGSFANSVFSVLLGWIRTAINQMWALVNSDSGGGFLAWIGENWKALTLILCGVGVVTDVVVYLFRWRPMQVWASFFRRLRGKGVKALRSSEVGDMLVEVEVEIPTQLSKDQTDKLNAFASTLDEKRNQPACVAFADKAARYLKNK